MGHFLTFNRVFFFLFFLTHLTAVMILGNTPAFAPDELSYVNSFQELYKSSFDISQFGGWWNAQTIYLRTLYSPVQLLTFFPISDLVLLRLYSVVLTAIALFLLVKHTKLAHTHLGRIVLIIFTFTPSIFLWTTLAIKESFILLSIVVFFLGLERIHRMPRVSGYLICFFSGYSLLNLKGYLYVMLSLTICLVVIAKSIHLGKFGKSSILIILLIALPYIISPSTTALIWETSIGFGTKLSEFRAVDEITETGSSETGSSETGSSETGSSETGSSDNGLNLGMTLNLLSQKESKGGLLESALSYLQVNDFLARKSSVYSDFSGADIYSKRTLNPVNPTDIRGFVYGISAFLLFPNMFRINGSPILDLIGFEIFFWIFLYLVAIYIGLKTRIHLIRFIPIILVIYSSIFLIFSEITEINLGTAIRHRSVLAILIIIFIGFQNFHIKNSKLNQD